MDRSLFQAKEFCLITFASTHHAIKAEKVLLDQGVVLITIPTPREVAGSCGLSVKINCPDRERALAVLALENVDVQKSYVHDGETGVYVAFNGEMKDFSSH